MTFDFNDPLGSDFHCIDDLDPSLTLVSGQTALEQSLARRLITPRSGLFYDAAYGLDTRRWLKAGGFSTTQAARLVEAECLKDERTLDVAAIVDFDSVTEGVGITIALASQTGPFTLTLNVATMTVELLNTDASP